MIKTHSHSRKPRFGVIGLGSMGMAHCRYVEQVEEFELRAVADIDAQQARKMGEQYGVDHYVNYRDMLKNNQVDAVSIVVPHFYHCEVAVEAFRAGVHVLCEKPLAVRASNAHRMLEEAEKNNCIFGIMFQRRTEPLFRKARTLLEDGLLGQIRRTLLVIPEFRSQAYYDAGTWRATWAGEGGGPLINQGPHLMDLFLMLTGLPSKVYGQTQTVMHDIEVEDQAQAMLTYTKGAVGYIHVSTCEPPPGSLLQICGDRGKLIIEDDDLTAVRFNTPIEKFSRMSDSMWEGPEAKGFVPELPECSSGQEEVIRNFARAIRGEADLLCPARAGVDQIELSNAIMLSSWTEEPVSIPVDTEKFDALLNERIGRSEFRPGAETETTRITDPNLG